MGPTHSPAKFLPQITAKACEVNFLASTHIDFPTRAAVESLAQKYLLPLPREMRSPRPGELTGRRTGSSVEYQDRKDFSPGDDLRHVDWRGFARSDRMTVKLYREEIMPRFNIIIDGSASMGVTPQKAVRRLEMAMLFWLMARHLHGNVSTWLANGSAPLRLETPLDIARHPDAETDAPLAAMAASPATRPGGISIVISDLLFPFDPGRLPTLFGQPDQLLVVQVLSAFEANPGEGLQAGAMLRLQNAEAPEHLDVRLNSATVEQYLRRLRALQSDLADALRRRGGAMATIRDVDDLDSACRIMHTAGVLAL